MGEVALVLGLILLALGLGCWLWPVLLLRALLVGITHSFYRLRVEGREVLPPGAALLVCHRVNYLDWLFLLAGAGRPIRFLLIATWTRTGLARKVIQWTGSIALDGDAGAQGVAKAVQAAAEALRRGEAVCLFAGTWRMRDGTQVSLAELLNQIRALVPAPLVPVCLDQHEGSRFHLRAGKFVWKPPQEWLAATWLSFGKPLPANTPAGEVIQAIQHLSADAALRRSQHLPTVHRCFVLSASKHPFRSCIIDSTNKKNPLTYGKALAGAMCLADHLRPLLGTTPMVAIWLPPGAGGALSNIALALMGKTSVNLNYTAGTESVQSALRQCEVKQVLTAKRFTARVPLDPGPGIELIYLDELLPLVSQREKTLAFLKILLLPHFVLERWVLGLHRQSLEDIATIIFSSGSTGEPKGVVLTHRNVAANAESMVQAICLRPDDRALGVLPFFHSFGYTVTLWAPLRVGASVVYHTDPRQAKEIGELCREFTCSIFLITPTFLRFCLRKCEVDDFRSVRLLMCGAEKLPQRLAQDFQAKFQVLPLEGYGCTELSPAAAANLPDLEGEGLTEIQNKPGTIGPPLPGIAARVVNPDTNEPLPLGQEGMLLIRGANAMWGYLHRPEQTAAVLSDNQYVTGDMGRLDEDGHITLTGRLSRFAKIGGEMVPLELIEEDLQGLLGSDGGERLVAVTAVPDEKKGERVVVLYLESLQIDFSKIGRQLVEKGHPNLYLPGERDFYPVAHIPVLGTGKLDLRRVKEAALAAVAGR